MPRGVGALQGGAAGAQREAQEWPAKTPAGVSLHCTPVPTDRNRRRRKGLCASRAPPRPRLPPHPRCCWSSCSSSRQGGPAEERGSGARLQRQEAGRRRRLLVAAAAAGGGSRPLPAGPGGLLPARSVCPAALGAPEGPGTAAALFSLTRSPGRRPGRLAGLAIAPAHLLELRGASL